MNRIALTIIYLIYIISKCNKNNFNWKKIWINMLIKTNFNWKDQEIKNKINLINFKWDLIITDNL